MGHRHSRAGTRRRPRQAGKVGREIGAADNARVCVVHGQVHDGQSARAQCGAALFRHGPIAARCIAEVAPVGFQCNAVPVKDVVQFFLPGFNATSR